MGVNQSGFLLDTNILIDYLADTIPSPGIDIIEEIFGESMNVSVITQIELLGWHNHSVHSYHAAEEMMSHFSIIPLTPDIVRDTISLKQQMRVKTPDAIIASTSRIHQMTLVTGNRKHFEKIPGLSIFNPWEDNHLP